MRNINPSFHRTCRSTMFSLMQNSPILPIRSAGFNCIPFCGKINDWSRLPRKPFSKSAICCRFCISVIMLDNNEIKPDDKPSTSNVEKTTDVPLSDVPNTENGTNVGDPANCSTNTNDSNVDPFEKFITVIRPLLTMPEEIKDAQIKKLREAVENCLSKDPKFREKKFYNGFLEEMLYTIEQHNYADPNTLLKEAIDEFKYNVDVKPKLEDQKELKLRVKKMKSMRLKLWKLHKKAQRYLEKEVDLNATDDEMNSAFLKEQRLARRILLLKKKINELQDKPLRTGSKNEKKYVFKGSEYQEINEALSSLINDMLTESHKAKTEQRLRLLAAPDLGTVHGIIVKVVEDKMLCLYDPLEYSKKMLRKIGEDLKNRRRVDNEYSYESFLRIETLKPQSIVPVEEEVQLEAKFKEHGEKARVDTETIIKRYAEQEDNEKNEGDKSEESEQKENQMMDEIKEDEEEESELESESDDEMTEDKENHEGANSSSSSDEEMHDELDSDIEIVFEQTNPSIVLE